MSKAGSNWYTCMHRCMLSKGNDCMGFLLHVAKCRLHFFNEHLHRPTMNLVTPHVYNNMTSVWSCS